jgi:hypothetical protein
MVLFDEFFCVHSVNVFLLCRQMGLFVSSPDGVDFVEDR